MSEPLAVAFVEVRPEVDDFRSNAESDLRAELGDEAIEVRGQFALDGIDAARSELDGLAAEAQRAIAELSAQTSPDFARGFVAGSQEAIASALELAEATGEVTEEIVTGEEARRSFAATNQLLAASETGLAAARRTESEAARRAAVDERRLFEVRTRSRDIGPVRLAGQGLVAGTAVVAGVQALQALAEELRVTGDEASSFEGKTRNVFSSLLSADVVGAFKALNDNTRTLSIEQLRAISSTEGLDEKLRSMGEGANIARSQLIALERLTQVPQFLQTRIAQAQATGNEGQQLEALERAQDELRRQEQAVRELGLDQTALNVALEAIFRERASIAGQIEALSSTQRSDLLGPLEEAVSDAKLQGDASKIIAALRNEARVIESVINSAKTNVEDRRRLKDELARVNGEIESIQDEIVAEQQRHRAAMIEKVISTGEEALLDAEIAGSSPLPALFARQAAIQQQLATGMINGKKLTQAERIRLKQELARVNSAIEAEQDAITQEAERHAEEMERKQRESEDAFLAAVANRQSALQNRRLLAEATAGVADDIRVSEALQRLFRESIAVARRTIEAARRRNEVIAQLTGQLIAEEQNERQLRREARREQRDRREEALDLRIQIAQANENVAAEIRAREAKIRFLQEQIETTRRNTNQRRRLRLEIAQERAELRRLREEQRGDREGGSFSQLAFSFLQQRDQLAGEFASNIEQPTPGLRPPAPRDRAAPSPFQRDTGEVRSQAEAAQALREQRGAPASQGQLETLIALSRNTNQLLSDIRRGVGHQEAKSTRAMSKNAVVVGAD